MSYQAKTQQLIKDPMEIIQGSTIDSGECTLQNLLVTYETEDHYSCEIMADATTPHHLLRLLKIIQAAFPAAIKSDVSTYAPTNTTAALVMYNLGKEARETINDDTFLKTVTTFEADLRLKLDGSQGTESGTTFAADVSKMWHAIGQGSDDMFGSWSSTQWRPVDDCLAGIWITYFYILHHWGTQCCTYFSRDYVRGIGEYISSGGAIEGRLKKLDIFDEADWPLRFLATYNGAGNIFGIAPTMVDSEFLKGIQIPLLDTVEPFIQKFFSRSRILWRYMRWVDISPIYCILPPKVKAKSAPCIPMDYEDLSYMALFSSGKRRSEDDVDYDWDWWNNELVAFTQKLQRFKFRGSNGAAFGKLKSRVKLTNVFDLPEPGIGPGGQFWHQMSSVRVDYDIGADDEMIVFKYRAIKEGDGTDLDFVPANGADTLQMKRNKDAYYWFQLIGDVDLDMFRFLLGTQMTKAKTRNGSPVYLMGASIDAGTKMPDIYALPYSPCALIVFDVEKDEDEGYFLNPLVQDYTFDTLVGDYTYLGSPTCIYDWGNLAAFEATPNFINSVFELNLTRADYFDMRSADPYKKLKHWIYDVNELDAVAIRNAVSQVYLGSTPAEEVAISAKMTITPVTQRKDGSDDSTHNEGTVETKISAIPAEEIKTGAMPDELKEKIEEEKEDEVKISVTPEQVKKAEKELKLMKKKVADEKAKKDKIDKAKKAKKEKK